MIGNKVRGAQKNNRTVLPTPPRLLGMSRARLNRIPASPIKYHKRRRRDKRKTLVCSQGMVWREDSRQAFLFAVDKKERRHMLPSSAISLVEFYLVLYDHPRRESCMEQSLAEVMRRSKTPGILSTPVDHARLLHPWEEGNSGYVTVARRIDGHWREQHVPIKDLPLAVRELAGAPESYISQNRFMGPRRITHLWQLDSLWADLDYHKIPQWAGKDPRWVMEAAFDALDDARIPQPSFSVATGRGLALVWIHSPVPRQAIPRWNACQKGLYATLQTFGADRLALDAARVLRLIGTQHARSGRTVESLTAIGKTWAFDTLADEILPLTRAALSDLRIQHALRRTERPREGRNLPPKDFNTATLWLGRLNDLQRLRELRWWGALPPGQRDHWLFLATVAMSWVAIPEVLMRETWALAHQAGDWSEHEARTRLQAIFKRARMASEGRTIEWQGQQVDPRYHFRNSTIIEWLGITPEEQRHMQVLIGDEEARRRHREAERARKHATGEVQQDRATYLAQAADRRVEARLRQAGGESVSAIAQAMQVNRSTVWRWLKDDVASPCGCMDRRASARASGTVCTQEP